MSPSWYATKREHGRVVPTGPYVTAHVHGRLVVPDDPTWVEALVRRLTAKHEGRRAEPWSVDGAPARYVAGTIAGLEQGSDPVAHQVAIAMRRAADQ